MFVCDGLLNDNDILCACVCVCPDSIIENAAAAVALIAYAVHMRMACGTAGRARAAANPLLKFNET